MEQLYELKKSFKSYLGGMDLLTRLILKELLVNFDENHILKEFIMPYVFSVELLEQSKILERSSRLDILLKELIEFISETLGENDFILTDENFLEKLQNNKLKKEKTSELIQKNDLSSNNKTNSISKNTFEIKQLSDYSENITKKNQNIILNKDFKNEFGSFNLNNNISLIKNEVNDLKMLIHQLIAISTKNMHELQSIRENLQLFNNQNINSFNQDKRVLYMNKPIPSPLFTPMYHYMSTPTIQKQMNQLHSSFHLTNTKIESVQNEINNNSVQFKKIMDQQTNSNKN